MLPAGAPTAPDQTPRTPNPAAPSLRTPAPALVDPPWFDAFVQGFRLWYGDATTPRDPERAIPLLSDAARLGHGGAALLLSTVFEELAAEADAHGNARAARSFTRLSIVYRTAAFWSDADDPNVELDNECNDDWTVARATPREPRLWDAIDTLCGLHHPDQQPDPAGAMLGFEALAVSHPVHAGLLASVAAEEAAERHADPQGATALMERARSNLVRSAGAGNRAAQKLLFHARSLSGT
ncbi:hypothetical protein MJ547_04585, partial [Burkholderia gladioli]